MGRLSRGVGAERKPRVSENNRATYSVQRIESAELDRDIDHFFFLFFLLYIGIVPVFLHIFASA